MSMKDFKLHTHHEEGSTYPSSVRNGVMSFMKHASASLGVPQDFGEFLVTTNGFGDVVVHIRQPRK